MQIIITQVESNFDGIHVGNEKAGHEFMSMEQGMDCDKVQGCCHRKATPREEKELKQLKNRLSRIIGQLNGIGKMLDENRYCGEILTQLGAAESALQSLGYEILKEHMNTCMVEEIGKGNLEIINEAVDLMKKL